MASASLARSHALACAGAQPLPANDADYLTTAVVAHTRRNNPPFHSSDNGTPHHAHRQNHSSSKLPAFRFADLRKDRLSLPSLHQQRTPLPPVLSQTAADPLGRQTAHEQTHRIPGSSQASLHHASSAQTLLPSRPDSLETHHAGDATRSRSLKFHLPSTIAAASADPSSAGSKRPASFPPETPRATDNLPAPRSRLSYDVIPAARRRLTEDAAKEAARDQRDLLSPRSREAARSTTKCNDAKSRPPVTSRQHDLAHSAGTTSAGRPVIPPIRSSRLSGSRKHTALERHTRRASSDASFDEGACEPSDFDRALRDLDGRLDESFERPTPSETGEMTTTTDNDNTADIFMKIAREELAPRAPEKPTTAGEPTSIVNVSPSVYRAALPGSAANNSQSRIVRTSSHRRPLSVAFPSHEVPSPPRMSRRLSDQRDNSRTRQSTDGSSVQQAYRTPARESLPPLTTAGDSSSRTQPGRTPLRPSPITPRQISFKDSFAESSSAYQRRRQSLTENNHSSGSRAGHYRSPTVAMSQSRTYYSSPLVPKSANVQADGLPNGSDAAHGVEGTESSSSTAAPSTVWDELDDLKSRIHRLELTGKLPSTAGAAASRSSDERPRTATTNATTMSASPRQGSGTDSAKVHGNSHPPLPRDAQPLLLSALGKTKDVVDPEVFSAIESAATDALALSSMIGPPGQPGPISSASSAIGGYHGSVTDRQLRKKADSICRSLTELCLALADPAGITAKAQPNITAPEPELLMSPSSSKATAGMLTPQRRPSAIVDMIAKASTSPRAPTTLEQMRKSLLAGSSLPSSRYATAPSTPLESTAGRKSSLLLARIRRTATEEPEEAPQTGRRSSLLLRTRRTGGGEEDEPEEAAREGRKTSLLLRTRKTMNEDDEQPRARVPSRAVTEINSFRAMPRDTAALPTTITTSTYPAGLDSNAAASSPLPRRRLIPSAIATRLANTSLPSASAPSTPARKYLERGGALLVQDRAPASSHISERLAEERGHGHGLGHQQRQPSLSSQQVSPAVTTAEIGRSGSLGRRHRERGIPSLRN